MSVRIGLGLAGFPLSGAQAFWRWVELCEESGVDSIWLNERLVSSQPVLEPLTALAAVAGRTKRLKFGMNAVVLPLRDPLVLAKECATIDYLSGGRLLPVFGVGNDTAPEWASMGISPAARGARANEALQLLARLWCEDSVTFEGKYYRYTEASISPKPVQKPLPLWIGGSSQAAIERTARYGTGWLGGGGSTPRQAGAVVRAIKSRTRELGREIEEDHYGVGMGFRFGGWDEPIVQRSAQALSSRLPKGAAPSDAMAVGDERDIISLVRRFVEEGVSKFVLRPIGGSDEEVLEQSRRLAEEVLPTVQG